MLSAIIIGFLAYCVKEQFEYDHNIGPELEPEYYTDKHGRRRRK